VGGFGGEGTGCGADGEPLGGAAYATQGAASFGSSNSGVSSLG